VTRGKVQKKNTRLHDIERSAMRVSRGTTRWHEGNPKEAPWGKGGCFTVGRGEQDSKGKEGKRKTRPWHGQVRTRRFGELTRPTGKR